jgi:hypothetical protein
MIYITGSRNQMSLVNTQELGELIRKWVYYDNLISTFNKQLSNARKVRNGIEETVIKQLQDANMENAVIQIGGGRLTVADERHTQPLSMKNLEVLLTEYYTKKGTPAEAAAVVSFIRKRRSEDQTVEKSLKRST